MRPGTFFPFLTGRSAVVLSISSTSDNVHHSGTIIDAYSELPDKFEVGFQIALDLEEAERLCGGDPEKELQLVLRMRSISSQNRQVTPYSDLADRDATVAFDRSDWAGTVNMTALLIRREVRASAAAGLASRRGAIVAWSDDLQVHLDEPSSALPGDHLEVRWVRFGDSPELAPWHNHLFSISPETPPLILLNSDFPSAHAVLSSRGTHGRKARIRDVTFYQIAHQAWTSLIANAIDNLGEVIDSDPGSDAGLDEAFALLDEHDRRILIDWAPYLFHELTIERAIEMLYDAARTRRIDDIVIRRLPHAIQTRLHTYRGFEGLVKQINLLGD